MKSPLPSSLKHPEVTFTLSEIMQIIMASPCMGDKPCPPEARAELKRLITDEDLMIEAIALAEKSHKDTILEGFNVFAEMRANGEALPTLSHEKLLKVEADIIKAHAEGKSREEAQEEAVKKYFTKEDKPDNSGATSFTM